MVIFGSLMLLLINSCGLDEDRGPKAPQSKRMEIDTLSQYSDQYYRVYTLEGCEYIIYGTGSNRWGSHKGNCKNTFHTSDSVKILKNEVLDLKKAILRLEEENKLMGSELGYRFYNEKK
jgi:hypothetical protein